MVDFCEKCMCRGKLELCLTTPCSHHNSWYTEKLKDVIVTLIDSNYGTALHDIGNGDGITSKDAKVIVTIFKNIMEKGD